MLRTTTMLLTLAVGAPALAAPEMDANLQGRMDSAQPGETIKALLYLHDQLDHDALAAQFASERASLAHRHQIVVETLQSTASHAQGDLLESIKTMQVDGSVLGHQAFWIANAIQVEATVAGLEQLAMHDDIMIMYLDYPMELVAPVNTGGKDPVNSSRGAVPEPGVEAVRAPECWDAGFDGSGVLVATIDTGVDHTHPALNSRWAGYLPEYSGHPEWAFLDPYYGNHGSPYDSGSHGTHTMGSVCGGSPGLPIGVAPGAHWMSSAGIDQGGIEPTVASAMQAFQWMVDPDGNPATSFDVPAVCSNSWGLVTGHGYPECDQTFWSYLDSCELAGTVILFSAGNEGSSGLRRPGDRATDDYRTCAVAAIDPYSSSWPIADFSSRGPTYCTPDGSSAIKPDIAAPGVNTYSSVPGGSYSSYSGTSMASPHVNGVVAIMRQANPELEVEVIKQIIYDTAFDLGSTGKDNNYGYGMIDAWEALQVALSTVSLSFEYPDGHPALIDPNGGETISVIITGEATPVLESGRVHYRVAGAAWQETDLVHVGGNEFEIVLPAFECGSLVHWYVSIETDEGDYVTSPFSAPDTFFAGSAYSGQEISFEDDFESNLGWTVSGNALTGPWERGVPAGNGDRCDPPVDGDGSGSCFVTGNAYGDYDIDDGSTILTSPTMDASDGGVLSYLRWYNNGTNCNGADPQNDVFVVEFSINDGATWYELEVVGPSGDGVDGGWVQAEFDLESVPGFTPTDTFRIRFTASDLGEPSLVEAGVDAILIDKYYCDDSMSCDINGDGVVNVDDLLLVIAAWGPCPGCDADVNGDDTVGVDDLLLVIACWG